MSKFASGKYALGISDRSGFAYPLNRMRKEWTGALESCLKFYHEYENQDEETSNKQIDTWKLLEAARVW